LPNKSYISKTYGGIIVEKTVSTDPLARRIEAIEDIGAGEIADLVDVDTNADAPPFQAAEGGFGPLSRQLPRRLMLGSKRGAVDAAVGLTRALINGDRR